jgi:hypothetical protein
MASQILSPFQPGGGFWKHDHRGVYTRNMTIVNGNVPPLGIGLSQLVHRTVTLPER